MNSQSPHFPDCFYRVSVKGAYVHEGKILLCKETESGINRWILPGGGMNFGESPSQALVREVREEMGLQVTHVGDQPVYVWSARFDERPTVGWFYGLVLLYKFDVTDLKITPTPECEEIKFFSKEELAQLDSDSPHTSALQKVFNPADFSD